MSRNNNSKGSKNSEYSIHPGLTEKLKRKRINTLEKDTQRVKEELQRTLSVLDFSYICSLFLVANDKSILHHDNIQKRKLQNLLKIPSNNIFSDSHNPDRVIFNFSSYFKAVADF